MLLTNKQGDKKLESKSAKKPFKFQTKINKVFSETIPTRGKIEKRLLAEKEFISGRLNDINHLLELMEKNPDLAKSIDTVLNQIEVDDGTLQEN